jgi:hypothetical protein
VQPPADSRVAASSDIPSRPSRRGRLAGLSLCLLGACALLACFAAVPGGPASATAARSAPAIVGLPQLAPPPAPTMARRQAARSNAERLVATPSTVPAAGGTVRLRARVPQATVCRFSSAGVLKALPSTKSCESGLASVTVRVPRNRSTSARRYVLYLTARERHGVRRTVRDVIVQRRRGGSTPAGATTLPGETAASGVKTHSAGSGGSGAQSSNSVVSAQGSGLSVPGAPTVTSQPTNQAVAAGAQVTFSAAASGSPTPNVQWQVSSDGGAAWSQTSPSFAASAAENGYDYRAVFTNSAGTATTAVATLNVAPEQTRTSRATSPSPRPARASRQPARAGRCRR